MQRLDDQRVPERLDGERLAVGDLARLLAAASLAEEKTGADAARVHERGHRAAEVGRSRGLEHRVGDRRRPAAARRPRSCPLGVSRPERMSAVIVPTTRLASGAERVVYLSRIAVVGRVLRRRPASRWVRRAGRDLSPSTRGRSEVDVGDHPAERRRARRRACRRSSQMYGAWVCALTDDLHRVVEPVGDRRDLRAAEVDALVHVRVGVAVGGGRVDRRGGRVLEAALMEEDDERLDALLVAELRRPAR